jgi:hypothetical protein
LAAVVSTNGCPLSPACTADALLVTELCQQGGEVDALVLVGCECLHAGLEQECEVLACAAVAGASLALREKERELEAMATVTFSMKCVNGVNLPVLGLGDSMQAKVNNQTNQNLARL